MTNLLCILLPAFTITAPNTSFSTNIPDNLPESALAATFWLPAPEDGDKRKAGVINQQEILQFSKLFEALTKNKDAILAFKGKPLEEGKSGLTFSLTGFQQGEFEDDNAVINLYAVFDEMDVADNFYLELIEKLKAIPKNKTWRGNYREDLGASIVEGYTFTDSKSGASVDIDKSRISSGKYKISIHFYPNL